MNGERNLTQFYTKILHDLGKQLENMIKHLIPFYLRIQESHAPENRGQEEAMEGIFHRKGMLHFLGEMIGKFIYRLQSAVLYS